MKIEQVDINSLTSDPANVRTHNEKNLAAIKGSLAKFGQQKPIVVNREGVVVAGNGFLMAARALGWKKVFVTRTDLPASQQTAFAIADNRSAELAEWDMDAVKQQLAALQIEDAELAAATGFDYDELTKFVDDAPGENALAPVISYTIIFDSDEQQRAWFEFIKDLKDQYPDAMTNGERLAAFLADQAGR